MLLWLKEAQSHIQVCSQGSHSRGSRVPRSCLAMGCVGHRGPGCAGGCSGLLC